MEHPLVGGLDHLSLDELTSKISELHKKLAIASRSGNGNLCNQIRMALESHQSKYNEKLQQLSRKNGGNDFTDKIDIS
jgi:hypothetical protein